MRRLDFIHLDGLAVAEVPLDGDDVRVVRVARRGEADGKRLARVHVDRAEARGRAEHDRGPGRERDLPLVALRERGHDARGVERAVRRDVREGVFAHRNAGRLPHAVRRDIRLQEVALVVIEAHLAVHGRPAVVHRHRSVGARRTLQLHVDAPLASRRLDDDVRHHHAPERLERLGVHRVRAVLKPREPVRAVAVGLHGRTDHVAHRRKERDVAVLDRIAVVAHRVARDHAGRKRRRLVAVDVRLARHRDEVRRDEHVADVRRELVRAVPQLLEREVAVLVRRRRADERVGSW